MSHWTGHKPSAVFRANANALITGAAGGIGLATAKLCASHSMNLILVDNNGSQLNEAKASIYIKAAVESYTLDVSDLQAWSGLEKFVQQKLNGAKLDFLHLNAAIGANGEWTDADYFRKIFEINMYGVIYGINTFFPHFDDNRTAAKAVVITGSKQGITNPPGNPAYNAAKSAIKTLAEHLSYDLAKTSPSTSVHLLVPGWTFTGLTRGKGVTEKPAGAWEPSQVAEFLYTKMDEGKFYAICPDNDVTWEEDRKRMMWTQGDIVFERRPQSRWREEYKAEATKTMEAMQLGQKQLDSSSSS